MTHYQKLATLLIRIFCLISILFSLIGFTFAVTVRLSLSEYSAQAAESFYASILYFIFSVIVFAVSKLIAKILCKGIENDER